MSELKVYKFLGIDEIYPDANLGRDYYGKACDRWERTTRFDKEDK